MVDNQTMDELLQAPTEGYGEAIVIPEINADHFDVKTNLLQFIQANPYHGFERENPHTHINSFKRITSTLKFRDVPNDVIKLMMFPYSLEGAARVWENASKMDDRIDKLADKILALVDIFAKKVVTPATVKAVEESCVTCGGNHAYYNCDATNINQSSVCVATGTYNQVSPQNRASNLMAPPGFAPVQNSQNSNTILNSKGEMKAITTRSGVAYEGPLIPTPKKVVERETEETTDKEQTNFQGSTAHIQPQVVPILEPDVPKTLPKPNIPYPLRLNDQKLREKATNQMEKFFQIFQDLHFDISFADALLLMPKFASTIKSLLANKNKLFELAKIPLNENCLTMLLKKLPEKLGDPEKFLIPSDRSITLPKGVAEDVFVKVWKFHFPIDFVVVDFEAGPRVPLILGRSFLRTGRALIDVYGEEITLRVNDQAVTFNLNQTMRYSSTYDDMSGSDFILEEIEAYLKDESISPRIYHADCDPEGDICLIEIFLNDDPFQLPPMDLKQGEVAKTKSSIEEPSELELKDLPSHLEYAYLEGADKLPGIDFMGPFSSSRGNRYILLAIDYLSKWVEANALPTNDARVVVKFLKSLFARFGTPRAIISDRGTYFCNDKFAKVMSKYGVTHCLATAYHPQTSGQVEVSNQGLKRILERTVGENRASWSVKLKDALWAFRTAYKTPIGCTPYKLVYGKSCHLPIELEHKAYWALKHVNFDLKTAGDHRKLQLNKLNELRDQAYENSLIYKEKTKKLHDSKIKNRMLNVGDRVLLFNYRLKIFSGKLKSHWSGPFTIIKVFPYETVELSQPVGPNFKVNGHRVKHNFGGDIPQLDRIVLNLPKTRQYQHKIRNQKKKLDQKAVLSE
uniref:Reverse transcriptase domain-containing protein n=1 Tax=Tanacetum cinerariifolium TaxID=118510 RepID=A0A6L2N7L0_TANCI|nr:reverse transcriptase domain-containing protein [Tanacetum cinerariifolium]